MAFDVISSAKLVAKRVLFPGLDLHTRCRQRYLPRLLQPGPLETLDAGSGNGALSLAAYRLGNRVLGVTLNEREARETTAFFDVLQIPRTQVEFRQLNIYELTRLGRCFDQIICSETLEHLRRDDEAVRIFANLLRPGGRLVLCSPYARHPEHALGRTDEPEDGGHVRDGYTIESYRSLLEPAGFRIRRAMGLGSPLLCHLNRPLRDLRRRPLGDVLALPFFLLAMPLTWLDRVNPAVPYSLAVVAQKD